MNKWLILFCAFLVFVSACGDKTRKIEELAAKCSKGDSEACKELADIAKNDKEWSVRIAAVEKLTDQKLIGDIAKNDESYSVRSEAVKKLTDQKLLADIAINDEDSSAREEAVYRLTDQSVLAKIALEDSFLGNIALKKLADQTLTDKTAAEDWRVRLILKFISAFDSVPTEHRERLMMEVLPAIRVLSNQAVVSAVGDIVSIKTEWDSRSQYYTRGEMEGEIFNCSIKVQKLDEPLSYTWYTSFPEITTSLGFCSAIVNPADLLKKPFDKLTDQSVLAEIAKNGKNSNVRMAAAENLIDQTFAQSVFAYIAKNDESYSVRSAAVQKLTDQKLLGDIAKNDESYSIRSEAVKKLTDQALLAEVAKNASDSRVRIAAAEKLINQTIAQSVFADIARNDNDGLARTCMVMRLTDQALLAEIAKNDKDEDVRNEAERRLKELQGK